jgi:hypothetical protein
MAVPLAALLASLLPPPQADSPMHENASAGSMIFP